MDSENTENDRTINSFTRWLFRYPGCHNMQRSGLLAHKGEAKTDEVNSAETEQVTIETNLAANNSR